MTAKAAESVSAQQSPAAGDYALFPNPAETVLFLQHQGQALEGGSARIVDLAGRLLWQGNVVAGRIGIADLPPGLYVLQWQAEGRALSFRFVKR